MSELSRVLRHPYILNVGVSLGVFDEPTADSYSKWIGLI